MQSNAGSLGDDMFDMEIGNDWVVRPWCGMRVLTPRSEDINMNFWLQAGCNTRRERVLPGVCAIVLNLILLVGLNRLRNLKSQYLV